MYNNHHLDPYDNQICTLETVTLTLGKISFAYVALQESIYYLQHPIEVQRVWLLAMALSTKPTNCSSNDVIALVHTQKGSFAHVYLPVSVCFFCYH